jgi:hypothetical protein
VSVGGPLFSVTTDGLSASVDDLALLVSAMGAYMTLSARAIASPPPVLAGDWETYKNTNQGPPGAVIVARAEFSFLEASGAPTFPTGLVYAPGVGIVVAVDGGGNPTAAAPVLMVRAQRYKVWIHGLAQQGANFTTADPTTYALAQQTAAARLADLAMASIRDLLSHPVGAGSWAPLGPERGEFAYGSALVGTIGPLPIPVLGDVFALSAVQAMSAAMYMPPATVGDPVAVS